MKQKEFDRVLQKYASGRGTDKERRMVEQWYENLQSPKDIEDSLKAKSQIFKNINEKLGRSGKMRRRRTVAGMAAILLAALGISFYFLSAVGDFLPTSKENAALADKTVVNETLLSQSVSLSDGTKIILESKSKLTVENFTDVVRQVRLQGKASFDVAHNVRRPFYVYTDNLITKVLGTSFTINTVGEGETVEVKTGRVAVFPKEQKSDLATEYVAITPNLQAEYNKVRKELIASVVKHPRVVTALVGGLGNAGGNAKVKASDSNTASWVMQYEEAPVTEILKALENAYCVKIVFDQKKLSSCLLTVNLKDEDLFTRLQAVCRAIGGSYQVAGTAIIVKSKGC